tara:strand:+ start:5717 stop:5944 length:228 start_codon:yes stop_codon:yes gene_type:complete
MNYSFLNIAGAERTFTNLQDYLRALENQRRVEHLVELNGDRVSEEMHGDWDYRDKVHEIQRRMESEKPLEDGKES